VLVLLASCAAVATTYIPTDSSVGNLSVEQARSMLVAAVRKNRYPGAGLRFTTNKVSVTEDGKVVKAASIQIPLLTELPQISAYSRRIWATGNDGKDSKLIDIYGDESDMIRAANALYVLKQNAIRQKIELDEFDASFATSLTDYRKKAAANTALPEEANKYKVQAEGAVRDKEFNDAADYYAAALKIAPWWPVGHFNRALVLGEAGEYELAQREMKYYLQLVPGAPNARAAQDKIYDWARLDSK
jgi:tetratricopeptide (TPR) repeat protein